MDQRRGRPTQTPEKPSFNIGDVDCTIIAKLESDALAKVAKDTKGRKEQKLNRKAPKATKNRL